MPHPARTPSKKAAKKKVAESASKPITKDEFDDWAKTQKGNERSGCRTCRQDGVRESIVKMLESCIRAKAYRFSIQDMREVLEKKHPDADVGQRGLERHLRTCERALYARARGRRNG